MTIRISNSSNRIAKGYVWIGEIKCYIEVWHVAHNQADYLNVFIPKEHVYSYVAGSTVTEWYRCNSYVWCKLPNCNSLDEAIEQVLSETKLTFFVESRKWLTSEEYIRAKGDEELQQRLRFIKEEKRRGEEFIKVLNTFEGLTQILQQVKKNCLAISAIREIVQDAKWDSWHYDAEIKLIESGTVRLCGFVNYIPNGDD